MKTYMKNKRIIGILFVFFVSLLLSACNKKTLKLTDGKFEKELKAGDIVEIGLLPAKDLIDAKDIIEPIKWIVLDVIDNKALVISDEVLFYMPYSTNDNPSWETSVVRSYLNHSFIDDLLNETERSMIVDYNYESDGVNLCDKVFIFDQKEFDEYMFNYKVKKAKWSLNIKSQYNSIYGSYPESYVLRYSLEQEDRVSFIDGNVLTTRFVKELLNNGKIGVRPSMWIKYK